jgi:hypothetical protein
LIITRKLTQAHASSHKHTQAHASSSSDDDNEHEDDHDMNDDNDIINRSSKQASLDELNQKYLAYMRGTVVIFTQKKDRVERLTMMMISTATSMKKMNPFTMRNHS